MSETPVVTSFYMDTSAGGIPRMRAIGWKISSPQAHRVMIIHGERDDSEMCLCGAPDYLTCPDWIAGNGTVSSLTFTTAACSYSLGHRCGLLCDCVCVRPAGHDGPHQCSAEAVRP